MKKDCPNRDDAEVRTARVSATRHTDTFPEGAVGLDSWANVYMIHEEPSDESKKWKGQLNLAWGLCACETSEGTKGIPTCKVEKRQGGENIDLLPLGWL